jgi:adenine-specific DNA-methyltransferase
VKTSLEVTSDKLRGGFYSPEPLVRVCLDRVASLLAGNDHLRVLEPSAGDGAFIAGLAGHALRDRVSWVTAIEVLDSEAAACRATLETARFGGEVLVESALAWSDRAREPYDVAVGNPPFVRFQFVGDEERACAGRLADRLGLAFKGVSNLWLPVLVAALSSLRPGGAFAFIVPAECFTGIAGHEVREWLLARVHRLDVDLFAPGSFPGVLQEVVVLSGRTIEPGRLPTRDLHLREHGPGRAREWKHTSIASHRTWTRYLLSPGQVAALENARALESVTPLGDMARFEVATVTGANAFFCVDESKRRQFQLETWARPLLARTRHATGLTYTVDDAEETAASGLTSFLLDFAPGTPDPVDLDQPRAYLVAGEAEGLPGRYKCRIREPWYRVPVVPPGALLMAKRSHLFPRVIVNEAKVLTTDTIYRGRLLSCAPMGVRDFTASFHNSLTLLTAEIEGRSFGGGVLELVPSEISRLSLPRPRQMADEFDRLDRVCRGRGGDLNEALIEETDALVVKKTDGLTTSLMSELQDARRVLLDLRLARNRGEAPGAVPCCQQV